MFNYLFSLFSNDMGIDLGTANTLVYVKGQGIVLREPSVVAIEKDTRNVLAIGVEAKRMLGKTPANIIAVRPLRNGVIADFDVTERMIRYFIKKVHNRRSLLHPRIVIGVPSGITEVEKRAVRESAQQAGAREVYLIEEPMAAAIIQYFRRKYNLLVGETTAEDVKIKIGSVFPLPEEQVMEVKGRDQVTGLPKTVTITSEEVRQALADPIKLIIEVIKQTLEETPAELAADLVDTGIVLAGGGALLRGLPDLLSQETELPVVMAADPLTCVVMGTGRYLEELDQMRRDRRALPLN